MAARRDRFRFWKVGIAHSGSRDPLGRRCRRRSSGGASRYLGRWQLGTRELDERRHPDEGASDPGEQRLPSLGRDWSHCYGFNAARAVRCRERGMTPTFGPSCSHHPRRLAGCGVCPFDSGRVPQELRFGKARWSGKYGGTYRYLRRSRAVLRTALFPTITVPHASWGVPLTTKYRWYLNTIGMRKRLIRSLQVERNRQLVLEAARRVFLAKGYAGSSLETIAEEAGFSKGVVYSQFDSKADLFLALLERRISERAQQNERVAAESTGAASVTALIHLAMRNFLEDPEWALLVAEFRIQAARDASLNSRYAEVHARTVDRLAHVLARVHERAGLSPVISPDAMAAFVLALG